MMILSQTSESRRQLSDWYWSLKRYN